MANELKPLSESQLSYAGGVNVAYPRHYRELREDQIGHGVNITVRNGWAETRPSIELLQFKSEVRGSPFEEGRYQGGTYFGYSNQARFVFAFGGRLFRLNLQTDTLNEYLLPGGTPFSCETPFVFFEERGNALVARDDNNPPVIIEGDSARFSSGSEISRGLMMKDGLYRLVSVGRDQRSLFFSDHEMDELTTPLSFTDQNYGLTGATRIITPKRIGKIRQLAFVPWLDTDTGVGPLLVFGEYGTMAYNINRDRTTWSITNISSMVLPNVGASGHRSGVSRATDYLWRDQRGRVRSFQNARRDESTRHVNTLDRAVRPYFDEDLEELLAFSSAANHDDRTLFTVNPESKRTRLGALNVRHRAILVLENDVALGFEKSSEAVWAGLWTGIFPLDIVAGHKSRENGYGSEEIAIIPSQDDDGNVRLYKLTKKTNGLDIAPRSLTNQAWAHKKIESIVVTRPNSFTNSMLPKSLSGFMFRFGGVKGRVPINLSWIANGECVENYWFSHEENSGTCMQVSCEGLKESKEWMNMRIVGESQAGFKKVYDTKGNSLEKFFLGQAVFRWQGKGRLETWAMEAVFSASSKSNTTQEDSGEITSDFRCPLNLFTYNATEANEVVQEAETESKYVNTNETSCNVK